MRAGGPGGAESLAVGGKASDWMYSDRGKPSGVFPGTAVAQPARTPNRRSERSAAACLAVCLLAAPGALGQPQATFVDPRSIAPFVPAPWHVVDRMLELAEVSARDVVFDLGAGDGRILLRAAKSYGAQAVGYEINEELVEEARMAIRAAGVEDRVRIVEADIFDAMLDSASVVTLFLVTSAQRRLKPKFESELRPGTRIVCYKWEIPGWNPVKTVTVPVSGSAQPIFIYEMGRQR